MVNITHQWTFTYDWNARYSLLKTIQKVSILAGRSVSSLNQGVREMAFFSSVVCLESELVTRG